MAILTVENISFGYGGLQVLQGMTFHVKKGEKVALIGPNGAGKTTVLNVLSGLLRPQAGKIELAGHDITGEPPHGRASLGLSRSFQVSSLFPKMTVLSNVLLALHGTQRNSYQMLRPIAAYRKNVEKAEEPPRRRSTSSPKERPSLGPSPMASSAGSSWSLLWPRTRRSCGWTSLPQALPATNRRPSLKSCGAPPART